MPAEAEGASLKQDRNQKIDRIKVLSVTEAGSGLIDACCYTWGYLRVAKPENKMHWGLPYRTCGDRELSQLLQHLGLVMCSATKYEPFFARAI